MKRVLSQKLLLKTFLEVLWGFSHFHHKNTTFRANVKQSVHQPLAFCQRSWTGSPRATSAQDPGRLPQKTLSKRRSSSQQAFYTRRVRSATPSPPSTNIPITTHTLEGSLFLAIRVPISRSLLQGHPQFPTLVDSQGWRQPQPLCLTAPERHDTVLLWSTPSLLIFTPRQSDLQNGLQRNKTPVLVTDSTEYFGLYVFCSRVCSACVTVSSQLPPAPLRRPQQPLHNSSV